MKIAKSNGVRVTTENGKSIDGGSPPPRISCTRCASRVTTSVPQNDLNGNGLVPPHHAGGDVLVYLPCCNALLHGAHEKSPQNAL